MKVTLIDHMGSDLTVANAARVSFNKHHEFLQENDDRLIQYLARNNHWTPFGHCIATVHVKAPIYVNRQLDTHQVGLCSNEVSRRYVTYEPEFELPYVWRQKADDKKQGSGPQATIAQKTMAYDVSLRAINACVSAYDEILKLGIAPEQARTVLPVCAVTEWYWTGSLAAWARVCNIRCKSDVQEETQDVAMAIANICKKLWPISWASLVDYIELYGDKNNGTP